MANRSTDPDDPRWLVEPGYGEAHVHVAVGAGATITPELRAALEALAGALQEQEVMGYATKCDAKYTCPKDGNCSPRMSAPCAHFVTCRIKE